MTSNSNFNALVIGDRILTHVGMGTVLNRLENGSYALDLDSHGPSTNGYAFNLDEISFMSASIGVPLPMIRKGEQFLLAKDYSGIRSGDDFLRIEQQEFQRVTIVEVNLAGFTYEHDSGEIVHFNWESDNIQSVENRLALLFAMNLDNVERIVYPMHGHADAHPSMETLSAGHRFNDGVHSRPKFYTTLFVSEDGIRVENVDTHEQTILAPDELVNYFQSVQPGQMVPGATLYRKGAWVDPSAIVYQKIASISDGRIRYTEDSTIAHSDKLSNMMCPLEQRKMYFYV